MIQKRKQCCEVSLAFQSYYDWVLVNHYNPVCFIMNDRNDIKQKGIRSSFDLPKNSFNYKVFREIAVMVSFFSG